MKLLLLCLLFASGCCTHRSVTHFRNLYTGEVWCQCDVCQKRLPLAIRKEAK